MNAAPSRSGPYPFDIAAAGPMPLPERKVLMDTLFLLLSLSSILVMLYALYRVNILRSKVPGGVVRSTWNFLAGLIVMFTAGYLTTPFFPLLPGSIQRLVVGVIFLAGAIFVVIVINLFYRIVSELGL